MPTQVLYHCPCDTAGPSTPSPSNPPSLPAYSAASCYSFHPLESLYFCDECDALRCHRCVTMDVASYFCPNCLFEAAGAAVKQEKNTCARNCFLCPCCTHVLSILASDNDDGGKLEAAGASMGVPPYYLGCSCCLWDSKGVGLIFDKPTGLSLQLARQDDTAPDSLEFERLQHHLEPYVRAQEEGKSISKRAEDLRKYDPLTSWSDSVMGKRETFRRDYMARVRGSDQRVSSLSQRWTAPGDQPVRASDLRPTRVPLKAKQTKRCPACRHIIIKPNLQAASDRFKIKLVALNYLPEIQVDLATPTRGRKVDEESLQPGRAYAYELSFINPLDDPIKVNVALARVVPASAAVSNAPPIFPELHEEPSKPQRSGWSVTPSATAFGVNPYSEVWELDEEEALLGKSPAAPLPTGILRQRGHTTVITLDLALSKEAPPGEHIQIALYVNFTYKPETEDQERAFAFWTSVRLGRVQQ